MNIKHSLSALAKILCSIITLLTFVAIIITLTYQDNLPSIRRTKVILTDLDKAISCYGMDWGQFPPDNENNGGQQEGTVYKYRNDSLVKYLDGDSDNGGPGRPYQYFEFNKLDKSELIYRNDYGEFFWYHNFKDDVFSLEKNVTDKDNPLHPWTNCYFFKRFQLYTKYKVEGKTVEPYGNNEKVEKNFIWITNYN